MSKLVSHRQTDKHTKKVACFGPRCAERRIHHERPDTPRGQQYCWVPDDFDQPVFCSIECMLYYQGSQDADSG